MLVRSSVRQPRGRNVRQRSHSSVAGRHVFLPSPKPTAHPTYEIILGDHSPPHIFTTSHPIPTAGPHSNLSKCSNRVKTTCLLVSWISPAKKTSSRIAYTL